jgi:hypothetical protein
MWTIIARVLTGSITTGGFIAALSTIAQAGTPLLGLIKTNLAIGQRPIELPDTDELDIRRAHAVADVVRSYALIGFLDYLVWATKVAGLVALFAHWVKFTERFDRPQTGG